MGFLWLNYKYETLKNLIENWYDCPHAGQIWLLKVKDHDFKTVILIEYKRFLEDMCEIYEAGLWGIYSQMFENNE